MRSINPIYLKIRKRLAELCEQSSPLTCTVKVDESYFGAHRVRGKRERSAYGKTIVFGLLKRQGKIYTEIVSGLHQSGTPRAYTRQGRVGDGDSLRRLRDYDGLVDVGYDKHFRVHHSHNEFANGNNHINGIESFWSYAKRRLAKFNGVSNKTFYLHSKETESRFSHRHGNLYIETLKILRNLPL